MAAWTPFCRKKRNFEHKAQCKDEEWCPYCGMTNPDFISQRPVTSSNDVILVSSSPPAQQTTSRHDRFEQLERTSEAVRQLGHSRQARPERPHAGSLALTNRPRSIGNANAAAGTRDRPVSQSHKVILHLFYGTTYDYDLFQCDNWNQIG